MFVKAAWRNVFRNRRRSTIVISAVAVGVAGALFLILFSIGMMNQMVTAVVRSTGHIQVQHPEFADNPGVYKTLANPEEVISTIQSIEHVGKWAPRIIAQGLARSATASAGVQINGVNAVQESQMTGADNRIVEGTYLTGESSVRRKEIIIGTKLADKLGVGIGNRVVLTTQGRVQNRAAGSTDTEMTSGVYRVAGIFRMPSDAMNESMVYINLPDAQELMNMGEDLSQIAVMIENDDRLASTRTQLANLLHEDQYVVRTWQDGNRSLVQMANLVEKSIIVYVIIIFIGAAFGIINTMLMAVFERTREFGIMRAIGTSRLALFRLVIYEAFFLTALGTVAGCALIGVLQMLWLRKGLDLSMFEESLASFGVDAVVEPSWHLGLFIQTVVVVLLMGIGSAVWPAVRAARLQPAETMRHN